MILSMILLATGVFVYALEYDIDRPSMDYKNFNLSSPDPKLCEDACKADSATCKAFTYVKPGIQGSSARCWLKNNVPSQVKNTCCVSGVMGVETSAILKRIDPNRLKQIVQRSITCPDPAADRIEFSIINKTSQYQGRVRITGVVKNLGGAYESGPNQQSAYLIDGTYTIVATKAFQNLAHGEEVAVIYERDWDASSPGEGEFPPTYKLVIAYDPDINTDGNTKNDDCNTSNNVKTRSGSDMNTMFKQ